jgi:hypothetical protein
MPETAFPISTSQLQEITNEACENTLGGVEKYSHGDAQKWNDAIINTILQSLISKTSSDNTPPSYKYVVNSTIIQHHASPTEAGTGGRRGMHSAQGAYWNSEKDGMWSYKWDAAEKKGLDVVIMVVWIGL